MTARRIGTEKRIPSRPPVMLIAVVSAYLKEGQPLAPAPSESSMMRAGRVKISPALTLWPDDAPVWTMLFSSTFDPPSRRSTAMDTTALGMDADVDWPANSPI